MPNPFRDNQTRYQIPSHNALQWSRPSIHIHFRTFIHAAGVKGMRTVEHFVKGWTFWVVESAKWYNVFSLNRHTQQDITRQSYKVCRFQRFYPIQMVIFARCTSGNGAIMGFCVADNAFLFCGWVWLLKPRSTSLLTSIKPIHFLSF